MSPKVNKNVIVGNHWEGIRTQQQRYGHCDPQDGSKLSSELARASKRTNRDDQGNTPSVATLLRNKSCKLANTADKTYRQMQLSLRIHEGWFQDPSRY